jgi:hypothetical protein
MLRVDFHEITKSTSMNRTRLLLFTAAMITGAFIAVLVFPSPAGVVAAATRAAQQTQQQPPPTIASAVDRGISAVEKRIIDAAEAMPEENFNLSPETLHIPGSDYKGARSFAVEIKHVAASNWFIWSPLTGDKLPEGLGDDGNGPTKVETKAEILKFLKDSFVLGHRAAATLTTENMLQSPANNKSTRLRMAEFAVVHAYDHYGQMVEYLRMNGIVPPASRPKSE